MKGVNEHIDIEPCGRHFGHLLFSKERETGDQFGRTIQPKYGMFTYTQIWLKKVPYAEVEIFSGIRIYTRGSMILPPRQPPLLARLPRWQ